MKLSNEDLAVLPIISIVLSRMRGDDHDDVQLDIPASMYLLTLLMTMSHIRQLSFLGS